ncbi:hypothetical protein OAA53_00225 [Salibacteraceae bacterium]|nr:hypothetical protein [Salibacteraceae bacterium]
MIDTLGSHNLFANKFIIGTNSVIKGYTKTSTEEIKALHRWIEFKKTDPFMDDYRPEHTQSIQFLKIIHTPVFNEVVKDLHRVYKKRFIYSTNTDFVQQVFGNTISNLKRLLKSGEEGDLSGNSLELNVTRFWVKESTYQDLLASGADLHINVNPRKGKHPRGSYFIPHNAALSFIEGKRNTLNWDTYQDFKQDGIPRDLQPFFHPK